MLRLWLQQLLRRARHETPAAAQVREADEALAHLKRLRELNAAAAQQGATEEELQLLNAAASISLSPERKE